MTGLFWEIRILFDWLATRGSFYFWAALVIVWAVCTALIAYTTPPREH